MFIAGGIGITVVEVIEPFRGKVYNPSRGSGGMFVHCAKFVA